MVRVWRQGAQRSLLQVLLWHWMGLQNIAVMQSAPAETQRPDGVQPGTGAFPIGGAKLRSAGRPGTSAGQYNAQHGGAVRGAHSGHRQGGALRGGPTKGLFSARTLYTTFYGPWRRERQPQAWFAAAHEKLKLAQTR